MIDDQGELPLEDDIIEYVEMARDSKISSNTFSKNMEILVGEDWKEISKDVLKERPELLKVFENYVNQSPAKAD